MTVTVEAGGSRRRYWLGCLTALLSAVLFSQVTSFARLSYDAGATPLALAVIRALAFVLVIGGWRWLRGGSLALPRRSLLDSLWLALAIAMMSIGYLAAILFIKVGVAVILLYTFPLLVALLGALSGRERLSPFKALMLALAFAGLVVATGWDGMRGSAPAPDWRGVALALMAALGVALALAFGKGAMAGIDSRLMNVWTNLWMLPLLLGLAAALDGLYFPQGFVGWAGFLLAAACYIGAFIAMFAALESLPPSQAALIFNIEPVFTLASAALLLGESISPAQIIGSSILLFAIGFSTLEATRAARGRPV